MALKWHDAGLTAINQPLRLDFANQFDFGTPFLSANDEGHSRRMRGRAMRRLSLPIRPS